MHIITQMTLMATAGIDTREGSHQGPVPGAGTMSLCPHQGHVRLGKALVHSAAHQGGVRGLALFWKAEISWCGM